MDKASAATDGLRIRVSWNDVQPKSETDYDWSAIDAAIATVQGKTIGLSVGMLANEDGGKSEIPPWMLTADVATYKLPAVDSGKVRTIILPWDANVLPHVLKFIDALCARYDGKVDYIAMGGLGVVIESYITPDPASISLTMTDAISKWVGSCTAIVDEHAAHLKSTVFSFTANTPFKGDDSDNAMIKLVTAKAAQYGKRFGIMNCSLNANSNTTGSATAAKINKMIVGLSATNSTGFQFLCSEKGFNGHTLNGTFSQALDAGIALNPHYLEIYSEDALNAANAQAIKDASAKLAK